MKATTKPVAGVDYPRSFIEFDKFFGEEVACRQYLSRLRWPSGFVCARCGSSAGAWTTNRGYLHCRACGAETSITAGTIFQDTRKPLRTWFLAMWFLTSQKNGASALGLQRVLGLGRYETAWTWLHKLRRAMVRPGRDRLCGLVEIDETYVGGYEEGVHGRQTHKKAIVVIAVEILEPKGFGRVRMRRVADCSAASLTGFVQDAVAPGSCVHTDGWSAYDGLAKLGYERKVTVLSASDDPAHIHLPGVHKIASLLKRLLLGTHQGSVGLEHLDYYLDEFTFRFNRRTSTSRGLLFYRLMEQAVCTAPTPRHKIVGGKVPPDVS